MTTETAAPALTIANLPPLGALLDGNVFAGLITKPDGTHCAVLLLPDRAQEDLGWKAAMKWAADTGGELPTRPVAALLFANVRDQFDRVWHWTSEELEGDGSYAWSQYFYDGYQSYNHKSYEGRARAVRRVTA